MFGCLRLLKHTAIVRRRPGLSEEWLVDWDMRQGVEVELERLQGLAASSKLELIDFSSLILGLISRRACLRVQVLLLVLLHQVWLIKVIELLKIIIIN